MQAERVGAALGTLDDDGRHHLLSVCRRQAEDRDVGHRGMLAEHRFDLSGVDLVARGIDEEAGAAGDHELAARRPAALVARVERRGDATGARRASHDDLSHIARPERVSLRVLDRDPHRSERLSDARRIELFDRGEIHAHAPRLGQSVELTDGDVEARAKRLVHLGRERRAGAEAETQRLETPAPAAIGRRQHAHHERNGRKHRHPLAREEVECLSTQEARAQNESRAGAQTGEQPVAEPVRVRERHDREDRVGCFEPGRGPEVLRLPPEILMRADDDVRVSGRPGRIRDQRRIAGARGRGWAARRRRALDRETAAAVGEAGDRVGDDGSRGAGRGDERSHFVRVEDAAQLGGTSLTGERERRGTAGEHREEGLDEGDRARQPHANTVAVADAGFGEPCGGGLDARRQLRPGERDPCVPDAAT